MTRGSNKDVRNKFSEAFVTRIKQNIKGTYVDKLTRSSQNTKDNYDKYD